LEALANDFDDVAIRNFLIVFSKNGVVVYIQNETRSRVQIWERPPRRRIVVLRIGRLGRNFEASSESCIQKKCKFITLFLHGKCQCPKKRRTNGFHRIDPSIPYCSYRFDPPTGHDRSDLKNSSNPKGSLSLSLLVS
jgi:hypothetical protein